MNLLQRLSEPLVQSSIDRLERRLGVPDGLRHLRWMSRVARPLVFKLIAVARTAAYRRALPADAFFAASLTATASEGCGHCLAMGRSAALAEGVPPAIVDAVLRGDERALPPALVEVRRFAQAVIAHDDAEADAHRTTLRARFGEAGLAELAVAVAVARVFPTVRRAAGFAGVCPWQPGQVLPPGLQRRDTRPPHTVS